MAYKKIICPSCKQEVVYGRGSKPDRCPHCDSLYWEKPDVEYQLFILQDEFLLNREKLMFEWEVKNKRKTPTIGDEGFYDFIKEINNQADTQALLKFQAILKLYCKKMLNKMLYGKFYFTKIFLEEKASDATNNIIFYYLSKPNFRIDNSFAGYAIWQLKGVLYCDKEEEQNKSFDQYVETNLDGFELELRNSEEFRLKSVDDFEKKFLDKNDIIIDNIIRRIRNICTELKKNFDYKTTVLVLNGISHRMSNLGSAFINNYNDWIGIENTKKVNDALYIIYQALKNYEGI